MGKHRVPHGEKSTFGQANGAPRDGNYTGKHRANETEQTQIIPAGLDDRGLAKSSRLSGGGWLKRNK